MEHANASEIPELDFVVKLYNNEKEKARREQRLKKFPKSLTQWRPEGGQLEPQYEVVLNAVHEGLKSTATLYPQHLMETKKHSHDCLYVPNSIEPKGQALFTSNVHLWKVKDLETLRLE